MSSIKSRKKQNWLQKKLKTLQKRITVQVIFALIFLFSASFVGLYFIMTKTDKQDTVAVKSSISSVVSEQGKKSYNSLTDNQANEQKNIREIFLQSLADILAMGSISPNNQVFLQQNNNSFDLKEKSDFSVLLKKDKPRLVIVIDDIGESVTAMSSLASLSYPVTVAIWPRSVNRQRCVEIAKKAGLEILIHQPMEPIAYPKFKPGLGAIYVKTTPEDIKKIIFENLSLIPEAVGLNNHMGSKVTKNNIKVNELLDILWNENKFIYILDSVTHEQSCLYKQARQKGFTAFKRDIFLDVIQDKQNILYQLAKAERLAERQGYAIAIGHPLATTLLALKEWEKKRNLRVQIVRLQDLLY